MPIVRVEGVPSNISQQRLTEIEKEVKETIASISELEIGEDNVSVIFPEDKLKNRARVEIIVTVDGLFIKPKRTYEVRQKLADTLVDVLAKLLQGDVSLVECFVKPFNPIQGFASRNLQ